MTIPSIRNTNVLPQDVDTSEEAARTFNDVYRVLRAHNLAILKLSGKGEDKKGGAKTSPFKKVATAIVMLCLLFGSVVLASVPWNLEYAGNADLMDAFMRNPQFKNMEMDTITLANGATIDNATNNAFEFNENSEELILTFGSNALAWSSGSGIVLMDFGLVVPKSDQFLFDPVTGAVGTVEGTVFYDSDDDNLYVRTTAGWVDLTDAGGTFAGGAISSDITFADDVDILPTTIITDTWAIKVYDTDAPGYLDVLRWTNATTPTIVFGNSTSSFALESTGVDISTAGAITNAASITVSGTGTFDRVGTSTLDATGALTLGNGTAGVTIDSSVWDISAAGAVTGLTSITGLGDLSITGDLTLATTKVIKGTTTTANTIALQVYDNDTGPAYKNAILLTNGNTPAIAIGDGNPTVAIDSSDWDISTAGVMTGIGAITSDGLITGTLGTTISGATVSLNAASNFAVTIGGGTGAMNIGTDATAQTINIATGAGVKGTTLGSTNTTSSTAIQAGSGGVNVNASNGTVATNINTGNSTGTVSVGGTGVMTINVGAGGTGAKTITIGDSASTGSIAIAAGTGDLALSSVDDVTLNGGSGGSLINIGTNTHGNVFHIGDDDTTADTFTIGSGKDTIAIAGISVTIGSTGTTSATLLQSGSGGVGFNVSNNQPTDIGTGTTTGTVTIGGAGVQAIAIGNGAAAKTVTLGSTNTTSTTNIQAGSGGINITGNLVRTSQQYVQSIAYAKLGATGAGWVIGAADNTSLATLPASQTTETMVIPITVPLKVGWIITGFTISGQIESAGGAVVVNADLRKVVAVADDCTDGSVGAITQISKTADYKIVDSKAGLAETVTAATSYYILVTGTTAGSTDIAINGVTITVSEI